VNGHREPSTEPAFVEGYLAALAEIEEILGLPGLDGYMIIQGDRAGAAHRSFNVPGAMVEEATRQRREREGQPERQPMAPAPAPGLIYAIGTSDGTLVKIGWTKNSVAARLRMLEHARGEELVLLGTTKGTQRDEQELHQRFAAVRMARGEWFGCSSAVQSWLNGLGA
jgi:T5orf172 domain